MGLDGNRAMILLMAGIVGFVVMAIMLPYFPVKPNGAQASLKV